LDPYHILQLRHDATSSEIKHAYRRLALIYHPCRRISSSSIRPSNSSFAILTAAYETLADPETRHAIDLLLEHTTTTHSLYQKKHNSKFNMKKEKQLRQQLRNTLRQQLILPTVPIANKNDETTNHQSKKNTPAGIPRRKKPIVTFVVDTAASPVATENKQEENQVVVIPSATSDDLELLFRNHDECKTENGRHHATFFFHKSRSDPTPTVMRICGGAGVDGTNPCGNLAGFTNKTDNNNRKHRWDGARTVPSSEKSPPDIPALVTSSSSMNSTVNTVNTTEEECRHYTSNETNRLFGGKHMELMYRARRWKPFTDPYKIFEKVFASSLGNGSSIKDNILVPPPGSASANSTTTTWTSPWTSVVGNTETIVDHGNCTVVSKNTRTVVQDVSGHPRRRILTRTVTRITDPETGLSRTTVTVTSTLDEDDDDEKNDNAKRKGKNNNDQDGCCGNHDFCNNTKRTSDKSSLCHNNYAASNSKLKDMGGIDDNATEATAPMEDEWCFICRPWLPSCV
jgi:hypothetical protein